MLSPQTVQLFDRLNCANKRWQSITYNINPNLWDNPYAQTVACYCGVKYALQTAVVQGKDMSNVSAQDTTTQGWIVNFSVNGPAATALGASP